ncbi:hypothetical protein [Bacillus sp. MMSF_3328]|uniref:hypothetical protein n=1 Tax=Bacillus sp. MMSF_3328 TaxID=3047080 RepID=UPI00273DC23F|nr:hypothetical protein [Bacillus sp. MMSF_3328]
MIQIKYIKVKGQDSTLRYDAYIDRYPDVCPICHFAQRPTPINAIHNDSSASALRIELVCACTNDDCKRVFIAYYNSPKSGSSTWTLGECMPNKIRPREFDAEINDISPMFSEIYNQAAEAEASGLNHIAGMEYRKALEFIIKDYLISFQNEDKDQIEGKFLGKCINEHITDTNIKKVSERAVWLGNDETHYIRKWITKDIEDLKGLIELTIYWIAAQIKTQNLLSEMPRLS